jgi:hypothetical protein
MFNVTDCTFQAGLCDVAGGHPATLKFVQVSLAGNLPEIHMLRVSLAVLSVGLGLVSMGAVADVYRYKDPSGNVIYTDRPEVLPAERLKVQAQRATENAEEAQDDDAAALAERDKARSEALKSQADKKKAAESNAASKVEACNKARQDYLNRMNAQRLYEDQPNGERRYLDDKQLDAARASAKQAMDALCN